MASFEPPADEALALKEAGNALFAKSSLEPALEKWLAALVLLQQREPAPATDEVMAKMGAVLFFVSLCSTWDRLNGKLFSAQDRNSFKLMVQ